jgi:hypothetical protein
MASSPWDNQPGNRNFLAPVGFKFKLQKAQKVDFFCNSANIPSISLGTSLQTRFGKNIDVPGDKMNFEDFRLRFLVDEDLSNYMEIQTWMRGLGFPFSLEQYSDLQAESEQDSNIGFKRTRDFYEESDGTLQILNSNFNTTAQVKYYGLFPTFLSTLQFDATDNDIQYFTAEVNFKYTYYKIVDSIGNDL